MSMKYVYHNPSSTLVVDGKKYGHGDDITELGPEWFDRLGNRCRPLTNVNTADEEE